MNGAGSIQNYIRGGQAPSHRGQLTPTARAGPGTSGPTELTRGGANELGPGHVHRLRLPAPLVNVNTVQLESCSPTGPMPLTMVDPVAVPNDEQAMADYLTTGAAATACLLLTARGLPYEIEPVVDADLMALAARARASSGVPPSTCPTSAPSWCGAGQPLSRHRAGQP